MNASEQIIHDSLVNDGWTVYRGGWPDFIAEKDGKLKFIEVKSESSPNLSKEQTKIHDLFQRHGLDTKVLLVYTKPTIEDITPRDRSEEVMRALRRRRT